MPTVLQDRIVWDKNDWLAGLAPQHANNTGLSVGGRGASFIRNVNPYRRLGGIAPGFAPTSITGGDSSSIASTIIAGDVDFGATTSNPFAYLGGGTLLNKLDLSTDTVLTSDFPKSVPLIGGHAAHANLDIKDVLVYGVGTSTYVLYSYSDGTDGDVGAYDIGEAGLAAFSDAFKHEWLSTRVTSGAGLGTGIHPIILGDDGAAYIGDGRTLIKYDGETGTNGTRTAPFTLPRGTVIQSFAKTLNYLVLFTTRSNLISGTYYRGNSTAWFWNYVSDKPNFSYDLSDNYVTAGFNWNGILGCLTFGRAAEGGSISTKLKLFSGSRFEQVVALPRNPPGMNGVEVHDSMLLWNFGDNAQSFLASYGSPWRNKIPDSLQFWGEPSGASQSASLGGICRNFGGAKLYTSSGTGTSGGLQVFSSNFGQGGGTFWQGLMAVPFLPEGKVAKLKSVRVTFRNATTAGRNVELTMVTDFRADTTSTILTGLGTISATTLTREFRFDTSGAQLPQFTSIAPNIIWSGGTDGTDAPTIHRIEAFYDTVNMNRNW